MNTFVHKDISPNSVVNLYSWLNRILLQHWINTQNYAYKFRNRFMIILIRVACEICVVWVWVREVKLCCWYIYRYLIRYRAKFFLENHSRWEPLHMLVNWNEARTLQWRHNELDSVSNHQPHHCLLSRLFGCRSKKTPKLRVTGLCAGNSPGTGEVPAQMASYAENVSIWWRHHGNVLWH